MQRPESTSTNIRLRRGPAPAGRPSTNARRSAVSQTTLKSVADGLRADDASEPNLFDGDTMMLTRDRIVPLGDVIWGSVWDALDRQTFPSTFALARRIGRFYGYNSPDPTHPGMESDGIARRITDALASIILNSLRHDLEVRDKHHTFAEFVPSGQGRHAPLSDLLRVALRAAGIVVLSVEEVNAP